MIIVFLYVAMYVLLKKVRISKIYSILYTILIFIFSKRVIDYGANYNILALAFSIIGITLNIERYINNKENKYYNLIQGTIIFLIIFTKQNIGAYYLVANILVELIVNKKKTLKNILRQVSIVSVITTTYLVYLAMNDSLYNFIDYTILGMKEFVTENKFVYTNYLTVYIPMIIYNCFVIFKYKKEKKVEDIVRILMIYSIIYLLITFPILEIFHSIVAGMLLIISFIYCIHKTLVLEFSIKIQNLKIIIVIILFALLIRTVYLMWSWNALYIKDEDSVYYGAIYKEEQHEAIQRVTQYIESSKERVIILCPEAGVYNMKLGIDNGILDLPTQGNVGKNGAKKIIDILSSLKETKILLTKQKIYWQEYNEVREYVINNFEKVDEIETKKVNYDVYYIK